MKSKINQMIPGDKEIDSINYYNLLNTAKALLKKKCIVLQAFIRKKEMDYTQNLMTELRKMKKRRAMK